MKPLHTIDQVVDVKLMVLQHESHSAKLGLYHCTYFAVNPLRFDQEAKHNTQESAQIAKLLVWQFKSLHPKKDLMNGCEI
jgi:hypothetical protein